MILYGIQYQFVLQFSVLWIYINLFLLIFLSNLFSLKKKFCFLDFETFFRSNQTPAHCLSQVLRVVSLQMSTSWNEGKCYTLIISVVLDEMCSPQIKWMSAMRFYVIEFFMSFILWFPCTFKYTSW